MPCVTPSPNTPSPNRTTARLCVGVLLIAAVSSCAIGNKAEIQMVRHISYGQELIDLKHAHTEGAITDAEFIEMKQKLFELADLEGIVELHDELGGDDDGEHSDGDHD